MDKTLAHCVTLLRKDFTDYCTKELQDLGLSQGTLFFVLYVGKHPGCSPKELAEGLRMDTGHVTRSLAKLEQSGFLIQEKNPKDRRAHTLRLLEKGQDAFRISHELFTRWDNEVVRGLSHDERTQLFALLERVIDAQKEGACVRNDV